MKSHITNKLVKGRLSSTLKTPVIHMPLSSPKRNVTRTSRIYITKSLVQCAKPQNPTLVKSKLFVINETIRFTFF